MSIKVGVIGAIFALGMVGQSQAGTVYYISGHDSDSGSIVGGTAGGTSTESVEGAQYTISFAGTPSPTITLTGVAGTGMTSFDAIWDYNATVTYTQFPGQTESCPYGTTCTGPTAVPLGFGHGVSTFSGTGFSANTAVRTAYDVGEVDGSFCDTQSTTCNFSEAYTANLAYRGDVLCVQVGGCSPGQEALYALTVPVEIEIQGHFYGGDNGAGTISIDPYITLNPAFFTSRGIDPSTAAISFSDPSISNSQGSVSAAPEPAAWVMMLLGVGVMGAILRRRRAAVHAA